jgi:flavin-dependent dehydrogenase
MRQSDWRTVRVFIWGLSLGVMGGLFMAPRDGRRTRAQLAGWLADLYYELKPRLVAVPVQDIILTSRVRSTLRSAGLMSRAGRSTRVGRPAMLR